MAGICRKHHITTIAIGGTDNHVHALFHMPPVIALSKAVQLLKANSSRWMSTHKRDFSWQEGFGAFSVSISNTAAVARYIRNQEEHHKKMSFEEEYLAFLRRHDIDYDPRYVFD